MGPPAIFSSVWTTIAGTSLSNASSGQNSPQNARSGSYQALPLEDKRTVKFEESENSSPSISEASFEDFLPDRGRRDSKWTKATPSRGPFFSGWWSGTEEAQPAWGSGGRGKHLRIFASLCVILIVVRVFLFEHPTLLQEVKIESELEEPPGGISATPGLENHQPELPAQHNVLFKPTVSFRQRERPPKSGSPPTFFVLAPPSDLAEKLTLCNTLCTTKPPPKSKKIPRSSGSEQLDRELDGIMGKQLLLASQYPQDFPYQLRETDQFSLSAILSARARQLSLSHSSSSINSSDFVYLNIDTAKFARCSSCAHRESLPTKEFSQDVTSALVTWVNDTVTELRTRRTYPSLVLSLALIDHDYEKSILKPKMEELMKDYVVVLGIEREPWAAPNKLRWFRQMPYPAAFHLDRSKGEDSQKRREVIANWLLGRERGYVVSFAGKSVPNSAKSGKGPHNGFLVRKQLSATLAEHAAANDSRLSMLISNPGTKKNPFLLSAHTAMLNSTFCLQPPGDSPTRKGFFESILLGCIPVVFRRGIYDKTFPTTLGDDFSWDEGVAYYVPEESITSGEVDIVEHLSAVSEKEVRRRQMEIVGLVERIQFESPDLIEAVLMKRGKVDWPDDAFGMLLRELDWIKRVGTTDVAE
ncbi:hypothetical protein T439DRAFT_380794 [Meredithblackwellia eburnea MCA 4105]